MPAWSRLLVPAVYVVVLMLIMLLRWRGPMPESLKEYVADFDPVRYAAALPSIRRALALQLAFVIDILLAIVVGVHWVDPYWIPLAAVSIFLAIEWNRAWRSAVVGVGFASGYWWGPKASTRDLGWWQLHLKPIVWSRFWALCRRRTADVVLCAVSFGALHVPVALLIGKLVLSWGRAMLFELRG